MHIIVIFETSAYIYFQWCYLYIFITVSSHPTLLSILSLPTEIETASITEEKILLIKFDFFYDTLVDSRCSTLSFQSPIKQLLIKEFILVLF